MIKQRHVKRTYNVSHNLIQVLNSTGQLWLMLICVIIRDKSESCMLLCKWERTTLLLFFQDFEKSIIVNFLQRHTLKS